MYYRNSKLQDKSLQTFSTYSKHFLSTFHSLSNHPSNQSFHQHLNNPRYRQEDAFIITKRAKIHLKENCKSIQSTVLCKSNSNFQKLKYEALCLQKSDFLGTKLQQKNNNTYLANKEFQSGIKMSLHHRMRKSIKRQGKKRQTTSMNKSSISDFKPSFGMRECEVGIILHNCQARQTPSIVKKYYRPRQKCKTQNDNSGIEVFIKRYGKKDNI